MESVNSLRISAPPWWPLREGRDGKCEGRNEKCEFLARESVSSSPIVRIFGKGKCKFIANFSATMVTSLPSLSLCLYLSLSLSLSLSHRKYLTHNIGSASALPIITGNKKLCGVFGWNIALEWGRKWALKRKNSRKTSLFYNNFSRHQQVCVRTTFRHGLPQPMTGATHAETSFWHKPAGAVRSCCNNEFPARSIADPCFSLLWLKARWTDA